MAYSSKVRKCKIMNKKANETVKLKGYEIIAGLWAPYKCTPTYGKKYFNNYQLTLPTTTCHIPQCDVCRHYFCECKVFLPIV